MPDLHTASNAFADEETVDADFLHYLVRGAEQLQSGTADQARTTLEHALKLSPRNQRGQNLLALSYFKLGIFDRAEELYRALVAEHPEDASLKVNLGLVHLKRGRSDDAVAAFTAALSQAPEHGKAANYLGLAYLQKRDFAQARHWFDRAGNATMVEKVAAQEREQTESTKAEPPGARDVETSDEPAVPAAESKAPAAAPPQVEASPSPEPPTPGALPPGAPPAPADAVAPVSAAAPVEPLATRPPAEPVTPVVVPPATPAMVPLEPTPALWSVETTPPELLAFSAARRLEVSTAGPFPFAVTPHIVMVHVKGELFVRVDGLIASFGGIDLKPAFKRFRGRVTEKPFGDPGRRMMHASGQGRLCIASGSRKFQAVEIGDEPAYFREEALFAFEEALAFENGRVPSKVSADLQLVHVRNRGRVLIASNYQPRALEVTREEPCRVLMDALLGWHGNITPRVVSMAEEATADGASLAGVELTGEGRVLLDAAI